MKRKNLVAGVMACVAPLLASPAWAASLEGNVGVVSDYLFRGLDQSGGSAAVQGGLDYSFDLGAAAGIWVTNNSVGGGNEADVYGSYGVTLGRFRLDAGAIYYAYTEDTEAATPPGGRANQDYAEIFAGGEVGPIALKVFYTNAYGGDRNALGGVGGSNLSGDPGKNALLYASASALLALTDTISFTPHIGFTSGQGARDAFGDEYTDYSLTATKDLKDDLSVSLSVAGTDLRNFKGIPDNRDAPKFVIGLKKAFAI